MHLYTISFDSFPCKSTKKMFSIFMTPIFYRIFILATLNNLIKLNYRITLLILYSNKQKILMCYLINIKYFRLSVKIFNRVNINIIYI